MAVIDLINNTWVDMYPMGTKDWSSYTIDASDRDGGIQLVGHPMQSLYQPTAAVFVEGISSSYVATANPGVLKTYTFAEHGVDFTDNERGKTVYDDGMIDISLTPPGILLDLQSEARLGRVHISLIDGRGIIDPDLITDIHLFGGRDMSFWSPITKKVELNSGDDLEQMSAMNYPNVFNGDCSNELLSPSDEMDTRSDDLGPEPNVIAVGYYNTNPVIVTATRNGAIFLYSMPFNTPVFSNVYRHGNTTATWQEAQRDEVAGDGIISDIGGLFKLTRHPPNLFTDSHGGDNSGRSRMKMIVLTMILVLLAEVQLATGQDCVDRSTLLECKRQAQNRLSNCLPVCDGAFGKKKTSCQLGCYQGADGYSTLAACIN